MLFSSLRPSVIRAKLVGLWSARFGTFVGLYFAAPGVGATVGLAAGVRAGEIYGAYQTVKYYEPNCGPL